MLEGFFLGFGQFNRMCKGRFHSLAHLFIDK